MADLADFALTAFAIAAVGISAFRWKGTIDKVAQAINALEHGAKTPWKDRLNSVQGKHSLFRVISRDREEPRDRAGLYLLPIVKIMVAIGIIPLGIYIVSSTVQSMLAVMLWMRGLFGPNSG